MIRPTPAAARHAATSSVPTLALGVLLMTPLGLAGQATYDVLVHGGQVIDGTGAAPVTADVAVQGRRIAWVGAPGGAQARDTIDARGLVVTPGFIDVHNHSLPSMTVKAVSEKHPEWRLNEPFIRQGVTTFVASPDGAWAPDQMRKMMAVAETNGIGINFAFYAGHNGIRAQVMGRDQQRAPTADELARMKAMVREEMDMGAVGLSTGLMYEPGRFSTTDEVVELAREVASYHGIYDSHVRDPGHHLVESDREDLEIGRRAGIPAKLGHLKAVGLENKGLIRTVIAMVDSARARGENAVSDQYPYDGAAVAQIQEVFVLPDSMTKRPGFDLKNVLRDPALAPRIQDWSEHGIDGGFAWAKATGYSQWRFVASEDFPEIVGKYASVVARERGISGFALMVDLYERASRPIYLTLGAVDEGDVQTLLVQPWNMISSDGSRDQAHPRSSGTYPRVLGRYVRELHLLTLQEAVRKMTSLPADFIGLTDRGRIAVGKAADITVFDPATIIDRSDWINPGTLATGVHDVLVDGVPVLRDEKLTGAAPGHLVKRGRGPAPGGGR